MPALLENPFSTLLDVSISSSTSAVISTLASMLHVDSLNFSALPVLINARDCLQHALRALPTADKPMSDVSQKLERAIDDLQGHQVSSPGVTPGFLPAKQPALRLLMRLTDQAPNNLKQTVGNLLIISWLTGLPLRRQRCEILNGLCSAAVEEPCLTQEQQNTLSALLERSRDDLIETLAQHLLTQDKSVLRFNNWLVNHLRSELSSAHPERQRDSNLRHFLVGSALSQAIAKQLSAMRTGDAESLVTLIGFCLNLHWELLFQVPLRQGPDGNGHIFWLDPVSGLAHWNARQTLRQLGQPIEGCEVTNDMLQLQLPKVLAEHLQIATAMYPSARTLGDLTILQTRHGETLDQARADSMRAKILRSAPSTAIRHSNNRAAAAYAFLAFHLIDHSDVHYLCLTHDQIWRLRAQVFGIVGLGESVALDATKASRIGSARTPREDTVRTVFTQLDAAVDKVRVGRRYHLSNLIEHHNHYARRVGMFLNFVSGARASQTCGFLASSWFDGSLFGYLDDKDAGAAGGRTPIPISPTVSRQLALWRLHIESLQARLFKQLGNRSSPSLALILAILRRQPVPLLFTLDPAGVPKPLMTEELFTGLAANLNRDWGRHVMASWLTAADQPLAHVHLFLRHQGGGINPQSSLGIEVQIDRLQRIALSIDLVLQQLQIKPLPGLAGDAE